MPFLLSVYGLRRPTANSQMRIRNNSIHNIAQCRPYLKFPQHMGCWAQFSFFYTPCTVLPFPSRSLASHIIERPQTEYWAMCLDCSGTSRNTPLPSYG